MLLNADEIDQNADGNFNIHFDIENATFNLITKGTKKAPSTR